MVLHQVKVEHDAIGEAERLFRNEDGFARLVAPAGAGIDAPRRVVLAVNRKFNRAVDALFIRLVIKLRFQFLLRIAVVGGGLDKLHPKLVRRVL